MAVQPIPDGYHTITPYLSVEGADRFLEFLQEAFDAEQIMRMPGPNGTVGHAEVRIGDSRLMLTEACDKMPSTPGSLYLYVQDADATYQRALQAGAESIMQPASQFYGDRMGGVKDSFGNVWFLATHVEDVAPDELERRVEAKMGRQAEA